MTSAPSLEQWLKWVPRIHPETGAQEVRGQWIATTPDGRYHTFEDPHGVSEVGERIMSLVDGRRTVGEIAAVLQIEFAVARAECEQQTVQFIEILIQKKVLALV